MRRYDVFLCYKSEDIDMAHRLMKAFLDAGLTVFLDVIEGEDFAPLTKSIEDALLGSSTLVALITPRFPMSPHCRDELHTALTAAYYLDDSDTSRVMAIIRGVEPDVVRPRQLTTIRLPPEGRPLAGLAEIVARRARVDDRPFGAAPPRPEPKWHPRQVPSDNRFRGRAAEVWELHEALRSKQKNATRSHPVVSVRGPGGIGKTALCFQYARWFHRDHPGGVYVLRLGGSAGGRINESVVRERYAEELTAIAQSLGVTTMQELSAELEMAGAPYLWVVDDVPAATCHRLIEQMCAPTKQGKTLMTSRGRITQTGIDLVPLGSYDGADVLTFYEPALDRSERRAVKAIVELLGGHPLGLTLAAGLTTLPAFAGYPELLAQLQSTEPDRLETAASMLREQLPAACARPFANALMRSFHALDDAATELLCAASVLAPTVIPADFLTGIVGRVTDATGLAEGLDSAVRRGLLDRDGPHGYVMHALLARAIRIWVEPAARRVRLRNAALKEITAAVDQTKKSYRHQSVVPLLPHVRAVAGLMAAGDRWNVGEDERYLLYETGRVQVEAGKTAEALSTFSALRELCAKGAVEPVTAHAVLMGLAVAHETEGDYAAALQMKAEAFEGLLQELGWDDPDTLTAYSNLGVAHHWLGDHETAHRIHTEVYQRRRDHPDLGRPHRDTLASLNNLAIARGHLGQDLGQKAHHQRVAHRYWIAATARWRRVAEPGDPLALDALNGLVLSFRALGRLDEALGTAVQLRERRECLLGADHPDTLGSLENEIIIRQELHGPATASFTPLLNLRLSDRPAHPSTRITMANLLHGEFSRETATSPERRATRYQPAALPHGVKESGVRLDGEHVDAEIDLQLLAMELQQRRVDAHGADDPRTMIATAYLAYGLALADHLDGQLQAAAVLAEDAADGLDDEGFAASSEAETAKLIRDWIIQRLADD